MLHSVKCLLQLHQPCTSRPPRRVPWSLMCSVTTHLASCLVWVFTVTLEDEFKKQKEKCYVFQSVSINLLWMGIAKKIVSSLQKLLKTFEKWSLYIYGLCFLFEFLHPYFSFPWFISPVLSVCGPMYYYMTLFSRSFKITSKF
jgi:hypothetical protein